MTALYYSSVITFYHYRVERNNSLRLMILGMLGKGKTTLLQHLRAEGGFGMLRKGKTTLLKHLRAKEGFEESLFPDVGGLPPDSSDSTGVGIKISMWHYCKYPTGQHPEIEFYTWDCDGRVYSCDNFSTCCYCTTPQEEYHSIHQLFFHSRTLYLLVWNMLDGDDGVYSLLPWLLGIHVSNCKDITKIVLFFL